MSLDAITGGVTVEPHFNEHLRDQAFLFAGMGSVRLPGYQENCLGPAKIVH